MNQELDPRIKIRAPLRCDGIGRLDCAEDTESGGRIAVRWLPLDANGDAAVKACEKLPTHPRLPRIIQTGQSRGSVWLAMDFPEGQLLSVVLDDRLDIDLVLRVGAQLSDALATVHEQGVMHGELSAESVLLVQPERAYLWDMPLVIANRLTDRRGENRLMQNLVRAAPYLSPERARGGGASREGDVYALGTVLCIAAGAPLPTASTTLGVVHQISQGEWAPRVPAIIPDPWRSMLARMVSANPAERPTAREAANVFGQMPAPASLPTVPEFPAVKLPPELMAAAEAAIAKKPVLDFEPSVVSAVPASVVLEPSSVSAPMPTFTGESPLVEAQPRTESTDSFEVAPRDVLKVPTMEMMAVMGESLAPTPTVPMLPVAQIIAATATAPTASVQLTETISVSEDLHEAGARAVSTKGPLMMTAGLVGAVAAMALVAASLWSRHPAAPAPVAAVTPRVVVAAPAPTPDEDLVPLTPRSRRVARAEHPRPAPAPAAAAPREVEVEMVVPAAPASDFSFLEEQGERSHAELKRPSP
jgi:serine/threonine protein kinase